MLDPALSRCFQDKKTPILAITLLCI